MEKINGLFFFFLFIFFLYFWVINTSFVEVSFQKKKYFF